MSTPADERLDAWVAGLKPGAVVRIRADGRAAQLGGLARFAGSEARVRSMNTVGLMLTIPGEPGEWFATIDDIDPLEGT